MIKDSGTRREFESGAVRDVQEGKGRCDLLPFDAVAKVLDGDPVFKRLNHYMNTGDPKELVSAILCFADDLKSNDAALMLEVSKQFEDGAQKYGERNWEKGIPLHCYIDSGVRHYLKFRAGETDERHDRAFLWNMLCAIWTQEHRPECIDLPFNEKKDESGSLTAKRQKVRD